ncbi:GDSL-type esterase/lipase family protein [Nocardioides antri]|uniref:Fibronectin type-III domain-containing protein n=1 Tax=Nocardioides antri TaxID=2607659 RepID=A0A5B1M2N3_9ACTN|nr:GDSL-type esterase/lipase family protein [Nocardioides antri]KAA1427465.1 hypothetical protein F0U47_08320 [Nocardioides antri]
MVTRALRHAAVAVALAVMAAMAPTAAHSETAGAGDAAALRILLVGDSVTHGSAGDWTWRHRLHQHLTAAGVDFDFVGPSNDLYDNVAGTAGSFAYADPAFDTDHAAKWGMWISRIKYPIGDLVATYDPDIVVEMLGVNDLAHGVWHGAVAYEVAELVRDARAVKPTVDVVVAEATQHWLPGVPAFNTALDGVAGRLSTPESTVVVADTATGYDAAAHTWDGSHPNARGEVRIAAAVADSLHVLGVGPGVEHPPPPPPVGPRTAAQLTVRAGDGSVDLRWTGSPGATGQYVWVRDRTLDGPWDRMPAQVTGTSSTLDSLDNGHRYQFRTQPVKGDDEPEGEVFSNVVAATPRPPAPAWLRAEGGRSCARLSWTAPVGASAYRVLLRQDDGWRVLARPDRPSAVVQDLPPATSWVIGVQAIRDGVRSVPAPVRVLRDRSVESCR